MAKKTVRISNNDTIFFQGSPQDKAKLSLNARVMPEDGWVTGMGMTLSVEPDATSPVDIRFVLYKGESRVTYSPLISVGAKTFKEFIVDWPGFRFERGQAIRWGYHRASAFDFDRELKVPVKTGQGSSNDFFVGRFDGTSIPPENHGGGVIDDIYDGHQATGYYTYQSNEDPSKGEWRSPTPSGQQTGKKYTFKGTVPHGNGDAAYDRTTQVQIRVYERSKGPTASGMVFNQIITLDNSLAPGAVFEITRNIPVSAGGFYSCDFRHFDTFGAVSPFSDSRNFSVVAGPDTPVPTSPVSGAKLDQISDITWSGTYSHSDGVNGDAVRLRIWNGSGTAVLHFSGIISKVSSPDTGWNVFPADWNPMLEWGKRYGWDVQWRDQNGNWSNYCEIQPFKTNSFPTKPVNLEPGGDKITPVADFRATIQDPDGDPVVAAEIEIVNADTNVVLAGYPKAMTVDGNEATFSSPDLTLNTRYKWRVRGKDAIGWGAQSNYAFYTYAQVPELSWVVPVAERRNLVTNPSAEYGGLVAANYWTLQGDVAGESVVVESDGDAASGVSAWKAITVDLSTLVYAGSVHPIQASTPYLIYSESKYELGSVSSSFKVVCQDASGVALGEVFPSSIAPMQNSPLSLGWLPYGGVVYPEGSANTPAFPAGTAQIYIERLPSEGVAGEVRFDAFMVEALPNLSAANMSNLQDWLGYFDGNEEGYGEAGGADYGWVGDPGNSQSLGLSMLSEPNPTMVFSYSSGSGALQVNRRLYVERLQDGSWSPAYDSGLISDALTSFDIPAGVLTNESRYRARVEATDQNGALGDSGWIEFDVRYRGPEQSTITVAQSLSDLGALQVQWTQTEVLQDEWQGYDVWIYSNLDGWAKFRVYDPTQTEFVYPYAVSGETYDVQVRQRANTGSGLVESKWSRGRVNVEYDGWWLKAVDDPVGLALPFTVYAQDGYAIDDSDDVQTVRPWKSGRKVHSVNPSDDGTSSITIRIWDEINEPGDIEAKLAVIRYIRKYKPTLCLLAQRPTEKRFVHPLRISQVSEPLPGYMTAVIEIEDTFFTEDELERGEL